ncbi:type VI secretion system contractile sheath domain-containing protein [Escherichia coli]
MIVEEIINNTRAVRQDSEKNRFKLQVNNFLAEVASGSFIINSDLIGSIEKRIADIDKLMSEQLSLIMHASEFQKIESAWTGLYKLVQASVTDNVKYTVLHCTKKSYSKILNHPPISTSLYCLKIFMKAVLEPWGNTIFCFCGLLR